MEIPQLKQLAGRVRALLQQYSAIVGHNQALDLAAALPGLRNWPEVIAFPERVAACNLDAASAGRLAYRLKKNFALELTPKDLLSALAPDMPGPSQRALQVWPGGPPPGVYVTTSERAISALMDRYEEATDGALTYAERAGSGQGTIELGEYGLWSAGIDRLPTGTLLVVGPIELDQQSWDDAARRVHMACLHALNSNHRVAVLVKTPTPDMLCADLVVLVQSADDEPSDVDSALAGFVSEHGDLESRRPFAGAYPKPVAIRANADIEALPVSTREALRRELAGCTSGIVIFGSSEIAEHSASEQLAAGLALTEHAGPAARIMPRHRGTPAKDWLVPEAIKALPFLPSIESAYAQGYRRMVIHPHYSRHVLTDYGDVLFLGGTWGHDVADISLPLIAGGAGERDAHIIQRIVAVLGLFNVSGRRGKMVAADLFLRRGLVGPTGRTYEEFEVFLRSNRVVRWEDELTSLLGAGTVTLTGIKKAGQRHHRVTEFLTQRRSVKKAP